MANLTPNPGWDNVVQIETNTPLLGGAGGPLNSAPQALLNRTEFLNNLFQTFSNNVQQSVDDAVMASNLAEGYANDAIAASLQVNDAIQNINTIAKTNNVPTPDVEFAGFYSVVLNSQTFYVPFYRTLFSNPVASLSVDFLNNTYMISKVPALKSLEVDFKLNIYKLDQE